MSKSDDQLKSELKDAGVTPPKGKGKGTTASTGTGDGAKIEKQPRAKIEPGMTPSQILAAHMPDTALLYQACRTNKDDMDPANKTVYNRLGGVIDSLAKKVAEKAINLIRYQSEPKSVQVYTRLGLDHLIDNGTATSKSITNLFRENKYSEGTARAQANQIMQLLPALGVAERPDRGTLNLVKGSPIVVNYTKAVKAAAKASTQPA